MIVLRNKQYENNNKGFLLSSPKLQNRSNTRFNILEKIPLDTNNSPEAERSSRVTYANNYMKSWASVDEKM